MNLIKKIKLLYNFSRFVINSFSLQALNCNQMTSNNTTTEAEGKIVVKNFEMS